MNKRRCKNRGKQNIKDEVKFFSKDEMIEIQAEAYYRALKKLELEKNQQSTPQKNYKWSEKLLLIINMIVFPWRIIKKDQVSSKIYDSILVFIVSYTLMGIGSVLWLLGVIAVVNALRNLLYISLSKVIYSILLGIVCIFFGSLTVVSGKKFEDELDSNRIYAFSASIFALISCIAGILAILK